MTTAATTAGGRVATGPTTDPTEPTQPVRVLGDSPATAAGESPASADVPPRPPTWLRWSSAPDRSTPQERPLSTRRVVVQLVVGVLVVLAVVTVGGSLAARRLAEREAVNDAAQIADVLAETVDPARPHRRRCSPVTPPPHAQFDALVRDRVLGDNVVRVKIWSPEGEVLYSDQPELIGQRFALDAEEREVLSDPRTVAEISDLDRAENSLDREIGDRLVEVYRPVWTASGRRGAVRDLHAVRRGRATHRPAVARFRRGDPEQPAAVPGPGGAARVAPGLARPARAAPARASAPARRGRLGRRTAPDRGHACTTGRCRTWRRRPS